MKLSSSIIFSSRRKFLTFSILASSKAVCSRSCIVAVSFIAPPVTTYTPFASLMAYILNQDDRPTRFFRRAFSLPNKLSAIRLLLNGRNIKSRFASGDMSIIMASSFSLSSMVRVMASLIFVILKKLSKSLELALKKLLSQATSFHWSNREYRILSSSPSYLTDRPEPPIFSYIVESHILHFSAKIQNLYIRYNL